jgi:hypothetical protein
MASMKAPYRQVIITEYRADGTMVAGSSLSNAGSYVQLTNMGDSTVNLKHYDWLAVDQRSWDVGAENVIRDAEGNITNVYHPSTDIWHRFWGTLPDYLLEPGESFVMMPVWDRTYEDGTLIQRERLVEVSNFFVYPAENLTDSTIYNSYYPEWQNYDFDSLSAQGASRVMLQSSMLGLSPAGRSMLRHRIYNDEGEVVDSILVDGIKLIFDEDGGGDHDSPSIAGVEEAMEDHIIIRKSNVRQGNLNWDLSAGVSSEDSEWLLVPKFAGRDIWTTTGVHGNFTISASSETLGIDLENETLTVPWGIYKINNGDSIIRYDIEVGPGMAWEYIENANNFEGRGHTIVQDGDTLVLYAAGETLDVRELRVIRQAPEANETRVFPRRVRGVTDLETGLPTWGGIPYEVREYGSVMDTIKNIPYGQRVDSLFKYLEKPDQASWEIVWSDGVERVDMRNGDILKVTAENGTDTREYYLDLLDFMPSNNAELASITWPDIPHVMLGWRQDTIPLFDPQTRIYTINLPFYQTSVPALQATSLNPNAIIEMIPAVSTEGTNQERSTIFRVTAQDDSTVIDYRVTFRREKAPGTVQSWHAEPILSEISRRSPGGGSSAIEIYNPGTEPIDLSNYLITVTSAASVAEYIEGVQGAIETETHWVRRYENVGYIPGMKFPSSMEDYLLNPGVMEFDPVVNPILEPGEAFLLFNQAGQPPTHPVMERADVVFMANTNDAWEEVGGNQWGEHDGRFQMLPFSNNRSTLILKILNDSIQQGLKPISDPDDFEIIDLFGRMTGNFDVVGGVDVNHNQQLTLRRKPHILEGNTVDRGGFGTTREDSDWIIIHNGDLYEGIQYTQANLITDFGFHTANDATRFISVVFSLLYSVDEGYEGDLEIRGVSNGEDVQTFLGNLIKADQGQQLLVVSADGEEKELTDAVEENDLLTVTSANGENQTVYTLSLEALDDNNTLTLADNSELTINRDGDEGIISGFPFGSSLSYVFEQIIKPATAELRIVNAKDELLSLNVLNNDTVKVPRTVDSHVYFKVTAENGDVALYHLQSTSLASEAYVLSDVYIIDQGGSVISIIPGGTSVSTLLNNLIPVNGASLELRDKSGLERTFGNVAFDDLLYVTSEDESTMKAYALQFINDPVDRKEEVRGPAPSPTNLRLSALSEDGTEVTIEWDYDFGMEYGFVIVRDGVVLDTISTNTFIDAGLAVNMTYEYSVYAYNEFGDSDAVEITVSTSPTSVEGLDAQSISIYPNPASDRVYFRNLPEGSRVILTDITGRNLVIRSAEDLHNGLSLQPYASGYYLIRIISGSEHVKTIRLLKQ